jgi:hypothetical protein
MDGFMAGSLDMADQARIEGTYLMTASAENALALAEPGEPFTAFTGELVHAIEHGVPDGPALLDMGTLYFQVRASLLAKGRPEPQERARNDGRSIALLRNRRGAGALVDSRRPAAYQPPEPPPGYEYLLRRAPRDILEAVRALRQEDQQAVARSVLEVVAGRLPGQRLAATLQMLFREDCSQDCETVLREVTRRPPDQITALVDTLRELGETTISRALLHALAQGPVDQAVAVAVQLDEAGQRDEAVALLDATAAACPDTQATLALIAALWTAGRSDEIDRLLATTAARSSPDRVLELADALRAAGREESAFGLYVHAADVLARRPPGEVAAIVHAMSTIGRDSDGWMLCQAALNRCADAAGRWTFAEALWAVGQDEFAVQAIEASAVQLHQDQVMVLLEALCASEHGDAVFGYCARAVSHRSPPVIAQLVEALRDLGRPVDANRLLAALRPMEPEHAVPLIQSLAGAVGHEDDVRRVFDRVIAAPVDYWARFIAIWLYGAQSSAQIGPVIRAALDQRPDAGATMIEAIARSPTDERLSAWLFCDVLADPARAALGFQFLVATGEQERVEALLGEWLQQVTDMSSAIETAIAFRELDAVAHALNRYLPARLDAADPHDPRTILAMVAPLFQGARMWGLPSEQVGALIPAEMTPQLLTELHRRNPAVAERLLRMIAQYRAADGVPAVVRELVHAGLTDDANLLLRVFELQRPQSEIRRIGRLLRKEGLRTSAGRLS